MITRVWVVARRRRGRKKHYALRWVQPILDHQGQPTYDASGKVKYKIVTESAKTSDKTTALALAEKKFRELNAIAPAAPKAVDATIGELADLDEQWLRNRGRAAGTVYLSLLALRVFQEVVETPERKPLRLSAITARDVENFLSARNKHIGARSLNRELVTLRASFNRAVKVFRIVKENPFANIELVRTDEKTFRVLSPDEIGKLLRACADDEELDIFVRVALETACRANEVSHIEWNRLDLETGMGVIASSPNCRTKARNVKKIALSDGTVLRLKRWKQRRKEEKYMFAEENEKPRAHYNHIAAKFDRAVKRAGIAHCTLHDFRDTIGSRAAAEGVNQRIIAELLGHTPDGRTTAKYYQHVAPETVRTTVLRLNPTGTDDARK